MARIFFVWVKVKETNLKNFLPLGIGYLSANLSKKHSIKMWDGMLSGKENEEIIAELSEFKPDVIAFSVWEFNLKEVRQITDIIRKRFPEILIIAGGSSVSAYKEKIFNMIPSMDFGFAGEGEKTLPFFLEYWENMKLNAQTKQIISGFIYKDKNQKARANEIKWEPLSDIKHCDYGFIDLNGYIKRGYSYTGMHGKNSRSAPLFTTRGCPFGCKFCGAFLVNGRIVRKRSVFSIISEIKKLYEEYGINAFNIIDDNFTFDMNFAKEICRRIINLNLKNVSFNNPNGVRMEFLDRELLLLMKKAGWRYIYIAPESGSEETLKKMGKKIDLGLAVEKIKLIKKTGLKVNGFFIIGYQGETLLDIKKTMNFAINNPFDFVIVSNFKPLPGTEIYNELFLSGEISENSSLGDFNKISYWQKGMTKMELKFWKLFITLKFHLSSFSRFKSALTLYPPSKMIDFLRVISKI